MTGAVSSGRVMVTGASRGIGRAVVEALAARGASVAAVGRDYAALEEVAAIDPAHVLPIAAHLDDPDVRAAVVEEAAEALGGLDGLVCAAGIARHAELGAVTEEDLQAQLSVNLVAPLMLAQAAAARMRAQGEGGAIVNVASTLAWHPAPGTAAYAASKGGVVALTRALARELAGDRIRVSAVAPGVVDTDMVRAPRLAAGEAPPEGAEREARVATQLAELESLHPLGRLGSPAEVAEAIVHLLDAPWTTGAVLTVDGGLSL